LNFIISQLLVLDCAQAEEMINEVRDAFKANLQNLTWMDKETRAAAESKADAITDMIGEPLCGLGTCFSKTTYSPILHSRVTRSM